MSDKLISIILPVYNGERYLAQAIESIISQEYNLWELIVIDDCSSDRTPSLLKKYKALDNRIQIFRNKENKRLPASLNIGHRLSKGDYITWTSDDNILESNFLTELKNKLESDKADIVYSGFDIINQENIVKGQVQPKHHLDLIFINTVGASFLYKKDVFGRNNGYGEDLFLAEDYHFWLLAVTHSKLTFLDKNIYQYRVHNNSLTSEIQQNKESKLQFKDVINRVYQDFGTKLNWQDVSINFLVQIHLNIEGSVQYFIKNKKIIIQDFLKYGHIVKPDNPKQILQRIYHYTQRQLRRSKTERSTLLALKILFTQPKIIYKTDYSYYSSFKLLIKTFINK